MEPHTSRRRAVLTALLAALALAAASFASAQVKLRVGPVDIRDQQSMSTTKTTLSGPGGTRTISSQGTGRARALPGYSSAGGTEEISVSGTENPGIRVEQRLYYVPQPGQQPGVIGTVPVVEGTGSIHRSYESETRSLPPVQIGVGR